MRASAGAFQRGSSNLPACGAPPSCAMPSTIRLGDVAGIAGIAVSDNLGQDLRPTAKCRIKGFQHYGGGAFGHIAGGTAGAKSLRQAQDAWQKGVNLVDYAKDHVELAGGETKVASRFFVIDPQPVGVNIFSLAVLFHDGRWMNEIGIDHGLPATRSAEPYG